MKNKLQLAVIISLIIVLVFGIRAYNDQKAHIEELTSSRIDYHYNIIRISGGLLRESIDSDDSNFIKRNLEYVDFNYRFILDDLTETGTPYHYELDQIYSLVHNIVYEKDLTKTNSNLLELYDKADKLETKIREDIYLSKSKLRPATEEWSDFIYSRFWYITDASEVFEILYLVIANQI